MHSLIVHLVIDHINYSKRKRYGSDFDEDEDEGQGGSGSEEDGQELTPNVDAAILSAASSPGDKNIFVGIRSFRAQSDYNTFLP